MYTEYHLISLTLDDTVTAVTTTAASIRHTERCAFYEVTCQLQLKTGKKEVC
jgi:hypothetical protein